MNKLRHITAPYCPIINRDSRVLILGTTKSIKSSELGFYYMHPQNRFWMVLSELFKVDFYNSNKEEKIELLHQNKIAISEVIYSCDIIGSKDETITNVAPNDIYTLLSISDVNHIFLNGHKAYNEFKKHFKNLLPISTVLPSTSPRNARYSLDDLVQEWKVIFDYL